jgi:PIN domain nuclease of toxin-antitoxin system
LKLLLDTHAFLWILEDSPRLSRAAQRAFESSDNELLLSAASAWEIAIKVSLGLLVLRAPFQEVIPGELDRNEIELLPVKPEHLQAMIHLPFHHKDPFDRLIIAQGQVEGAVLVTADAAMKAYDVPRLW